MRWLDEINNITDADAQARQLKQEIKYIKKQQNSSENRKVIKSLYERLDKIQFKQDYMCLIIDKEKDYHRACNGFSINGIRYKRLLGTVNGIKQNTIVFVNEQIIDELKRRIENGRNPDVPLVTAKLEAYKALTCSASIPVSFPNGVLVVNDYETEFLSDIYYLSDSDAEEPTMEFRKDEKITIDACDGFGLISPALAERWSKELELDYVVSGCNTRFAFEKGMVFTFDFHDFAEKEAETYIIKDAWGNNVDIREVELVLTTSMVKLWDSYKSCDDYLQNSKSNGYTFGIAKTCPKVLENERNLNYQFIQSYDLDDKDIEELISPTIEEIKDVLSGDWRKTILFLKGSGLNHNNIHKLNDDYAKAIMINNEIIKDPFVQDSIYQLIKNRINEAKVGVIKVHGNYSIVSGDPYALCQSIFGVEVTGLLKSGEIYNRYWSDFNSSNLACFRAPMTCHNNIRSVRCVSNKDTDYWFKYMNTCTIFNVWDTATAALNGCDYDGDMVMLTDNNVLVNKMKPSPALMCVQRRAEKRISSEEDFIQSNIESFGNNIGQTTNWITSMFEVKSHYPPDSEESKILDYRIKCGQLFQQNAIDKAKGIVCKPMPKEWHDKHSVNCMSDEQKKKLYRSIVADKKPYFMRYIYPALMKQYNSFIKDTYRKSLSEFKKSVSEMMALPYEQLTDRQKDFLRYYNYKLPVGMGDCVMNKICRRFEAEFDGLVTQNKLSSTFDYTILKTEAPYSRYQFRSIKILYEKYNNQLKSYAIVAKYEKTDKATVSLNMNIIDNEFKKECSKICSNDETLCNILLDLCYSKNSTKRFVWNMCGETIVHNLLSKCNNTIYFPMLDPDGDLYYGGNCYSVQESEVDICQ